MTTTDLSAPPEELTLQIPGLRLAGLAWGPSDGERVIALHGWLDNAASFARLAPLLPGVRLVALDLPGHGLSDHRGPGGAYHLVDWVADVTDAADALGWTRFSLLGHSMGASVACTLAGALPDRVRRLALVEGLGPLTTEPEEAPVQLRRSLEERRRWLDRPPRPYPSLEAAITARQHPLHSTLTEPSARLLAERATRVTSDGIVWGHDPRLRITSSLRMTEAHALCFLGAITCPTLLIVAEQGWPFDESVFRRRAEQVRHLELLRVPGSHHVHLDRPEAVAEPLQRFFAARVDGPPGAE
ncbi:MAG: alpha/beta hydrolase [Deltaproteobacteria bacterium]|nr:alpha/beta hydrolase [Deltaproteobacteria bacterium]